MTIKSLTLSVCLAAGMAAAPALLVAANPGTVLDKLEDFHSEAVKASSSASDLASLSRIDDSAWESQADQWNTLKDFINDMGRKLTELENIRASATPAEREAIDRGTALLKQMADNTAAAIKFFNNDHESLWRPDYQKYVDNVADESARLSNATGQFVRLEDLRAREKHVENTIGSEAVD